MCVCVPFSRYASGSRTLATRALHVLCVCVYPFASSTLFSFICRAFAARSTVRAHYAPFTIPYCTRCESLSADRRSSNVSLARQTILHAVVQLFPFTPVHAAQKCSFFVRRARLSNGSQFVSGCFVSAEERARPVECNPCCSQPILMRDASCVRILFESARIACLATRSSTDSFPGIGFVVSLGYA